MTPKTQKPTRVFSQSRLDQEARAQAKKAKKIAEDQQRYLAAKGTPTTPTVCSPRKLLRWQQKNESKQRSWAKVGNDWPWIFVVQYIVADARVCGIGWTKANGSPTSTHIPSFSGPPKPQCRAPLSAQQTSSHTEQAHSRC